MCFPPFFFVDFFSVTLTVTTGWRRVCTAVLHNGRPKAPQLIKKKQKVKMKPTFKFEKVLLFTVNSLHAPLGAQFTVNSLHAPLGAQFTVCRGHSPHTPQSNCLQIHSARVLGWGHLHQRLPPTQIRTHTHAQLQYALLCANGGGGIFTKK